MKECDESLASSVPDGWMHQKGCPEKLLLSMMTFCESKAFQRLSAEGGKPDFSHKEIRLENRKQKLQEFEDDQKDLCKNDVAKNRRSRVRKPIPAQSKQTQSIACRSQWPETPTWTS
jgi:hypothetical protein